MPQYGYEPMMQQLEETLNRRKKTTSYTQQVMDLLQPSGESFFRQEDQDIIDGLSQGAVAESPYATLLKKAKKPAVAAGRSSARGIEGLDPNKAWIIGKESSGRTDAKNPTSSAFGLGQLIAANRNKYAASLGVSPGTTNYNAQSRMMDMYVKERYGNYAKARSFWEANGWY